MLFKVQADEPVRKTNENIDSIEEFIPCNDKTLKYVFLMYDYDSPYSRQPFELRKEQVLAALDYVKQGSIDSFFSRNKKQIEDATSRFNRLQYNSEFETLISLKIQVDQWNDMLRKEKKSEKEEALCHKIFDKMPQYISRIKEMEEMVGYRLKMSDDQEDDMTSLEEYLEMKHKQNQK